MAKLSNRVYLGDTEPKGFTTGEVHEDICDAFMAAQKSRIHSFKDNPEFNQKINFYINKQENTNMNELRELTATLFDNSPFLEDDQRIVFQKKGISTTETEEDVKLNLIATGEVIPALQKHNEKVRTKTVREDILENTGREVMLKPIKKLSDPQLVWRFLPTA